MIGITTALFAMAASTLVIAAHDEPVQCILGVYQIIGKADCTGYILCVFGKPMEMPPCPPGSVFSSSAKVCVPKGSTFDDCMKTTEGSGGPMTISPDRGHLSPEERCNIDGDGVFPHPTECHAFYNCSVHNTPGMYQPFEQHEDECPYPQLFNTNTKQCDHFENVKCGTRTEFKDACNYKRNKCSMSHCIPCIYQFPNCEGKRDGINVDPVRLWTPSYAICYKERSVKTDQCQVDEKGHPHFFHPDMNECVPLDMIPQEHGGIMPDCSTREDGFYLDAFGQCDRYARCLEGKYVGAVKCAIGEVFDDMKGACAPKDKACGYCSRHC
ncbi:uncharacterized protein LOC128204137 [Mya arenaria]|uniref:uncharacterized protein LOC128204137 n=1 Tax=Mya arenaria TaxID=6604 RepID=UPI0022E5E320|nr:uncharacterized protein LOC128204137 [Mya arenaria]